MGLLTIVTRRHFDLGFHLHASETWDDAVSTVICSTIPDCHFKHGQEANEHIDKELQFYNEPQAEAVGDMTKIVGQVKILCASSVARSRFCDLSTAGYRLDFVGVPCSCVLT